MLKHELFTKADIEQAPRHPFHIRLYICVVCKQSGGTLIKVKEEKGQSWYAHENCWMVKHGNKSRNPEMDRPLKVTAKEKESKITTKGRGRE